MIKKLLKNQLISGSLVLFLGTSFLNLGNYFYHFLMARILGPADYGALSSLISLTYYFSVLTMAVNLVVVKQVSTFSGQKKIGTITYFYHWLNKKLLFLGLVIILALSFFSWEIKTFLHLDSLALVFLIIASGLLTLFLGVNLSVFQGLLRFDLIAWTNIASVVFKLGLAIFLVQAGLKIFGAALPILISAIAGLALTGFFLKPILKKVKKRKNGFDSRAVFNFALPAFFSTLAFTSLYTSDIILARHFLLALEAGFYAGLATLGKIIFFTANIVIMAMFPIISSQYQKKGKYLNYFDLSLALVFFICLLFSGFYYFFPDLMVKILYGSEYLAGAKNLIYFGLCLSLYSLASLLVNFYLSIGRTKIVLWPVLAALAQIILIFFFHESLIQIVSASIVVLGLLLIVLLLYYLKEYGQERKSFAFGNYSRL